MEFIKKFEAGKLYQFSVQQCKAHALLKGYTVDGWVDNSLDGCRIIVVNNFDGRITGSDFVACPEWCVEMVSEIS